MKRFHKALNEMLRINNRLGERLLESGIYDVPLQSDGLLTFNATPEE